MRRAYTLLLYVLMPWVLLRMAWRGLRAPGYWQRWPERFGLISGAPKSASPTLWVHAVSVGEVQAAIPLIRALRARFPLLDIVVTTTTLTGSERVQASLAQDVRHYYAPYDLPGAVRRFLDHIQPQLLVVMETEWWPNIFHGCHARNIPIVLANVRLSQRSAAGYARVRGLTTPMLSKVSAIAAQTRQDAERLLQLGAGAQRIQVTGSVKFDIKLPASLREEAAVLRRSWGVERAVWIAASTHEGEEKYILDAFDAVKRTIPAALLVLVPRHPERFGKVAALCARRGYTTVLRSEQRACGAQTEVFIGDSMGELNLFYAAADVAFVGGSLVPTGGHNLLEPAALGIATITGPFMHNFEEITRMLREEGAVRQIDNTDQLSGAVIAYLQDANLRHAAGEKGRALVERNRGALDKLMQIVEGYL